MTKTELIYSIATETGNHKKDVEQMLNSFIGIVQDSLAKGNEVKLAGLGSLKVKTMAARTGRNPQTGEPIEIPEHGIIKFTPAKKLKDRIH